MNFIFEPSLVLYLPLCKLDGSSFMSRDAYGHAGTVTGALWRPYGRYFDGTDDKIAANTVANNSFFDGAHTMIAWVRLASWSSNQTVIGAARTSGASTYSDITYVGATKKFGAITSQSGVGANTIYSPNTYDGDTNWHFLASVVDADGHINHFIVDGMDAGGNSSFTNSLSVVNVFYIGQLPWTVVNVEPWNGDIGEIWVYRGELTVIQIQNIHLATKWRYQ